MTKRDDLGVVGSFVELVNNHLRMWGYPHSLSQPVLIEGLRIVARIIDDPTCPGWLRRDAEWALWDSLDRLIHDPEYLDEIGREPSEPRREPVTDEHVLAIHEFLRQHAPEGLPSRAELVAELRYDSTGLKAVKG
jgi:hypothetical protein